MLSEDAVALGSIQLAIIRASSGSASRMRSRPLWSRCPDLKPQSNAATASSNGSSSTTRTKASVMLTSSPPRDTTSSSSQCTTTSVLNAGFKRENLFHCFRRRAARRGTETCSGCARHVQQPSSMSAEMPVSRPPTRAARKTGALSGIVEYHPCRARCTSPQRTARVSIQSVAPSATNCCFWASPPRLTTISSTEAMAPTVHRTSRPTAQGPSSRANLAGICSWGGDEARHPTLSALPPEIQESASIQPPSTEIPVAADVDS